MRFIICSLSVATTLCLAGCASPARISPTLQDVLLGRQLYDTPYAFIYASNAPAANQVLGDLMTTAAEFRKNRGDLPGKGLVIVTDTQDQPYAADIMLVCRMVTQEEASRTANPADVKPVTQDKIDKISEKMGRDFLQKLLLSRCGSIEPVEAAGVFGLQGRPAAGARWVIAAPTGEFVQKVAHDILQMAISQPDTPFMAKLMIAPLGPLVESRANQQTSVNRQVAFYAAQVQHDTRLAPDARRQMAVSFSDHKLGAAAKQNSALVTSLQDIQKKAAATQQAASQPGRS